MQTTFDFMSKQQISPAEANTIVTMIDLVTERGAFKGSELGTVSAIRSRFEFIASEKQESTQPKETQPELLKG
jgi:site-specific recombinase XerD